MRILAFILTAFVGACLPTGCTVTPTPAHKLFGTSNPTAIAETPVGKFKIPSNLKMRYKVKSPDGSDYDLTFAVDNSTVIDAEGNRIDSMIPGIALDQARAVQQEQIRSAERIELYKIAADMAKIALPLLARPAPEPEPTPTNIITPGGPIP